MASFFSNTLLGSYTTPDSIDDLLLRVALRRRASDRIGTATRNSVQPDGYAFHGAVAPLRR